MQEIKNFNEVIKYLDENLNSYYFGGTIPLYLYGIVNRKPKDIDEILTHDEFNLIKPKLEGEDVVTNKFSDENDSRIISFSLGGYDIDFIKMDIKYENILKNPDLRAGYLGYFLYYDRELPFLHPLTAIEAKKGYINNAVKILIENKYLTEKRHTSLLKHIDDVNNYNITENKTQLLTNLTEYLK